MGRGRELAGGDRLRPLTPIRASLCDARRGPGLHGRCGEGEQAEGLCTVACNGCGKCVLDAPEGVIDMVNGLAVIDYTKNELVDSSATKRCPTGAIAWVEGVQFEDGPHVT